MFSYVSTYLSLHSLFFLLLLRTVFTTVLPSGTSGSNTPLSNLSPHLQCPGYHIPIISVTIWPTLTWVSLISRAIIKCMICSDHRFPPIQIMWKCLVDLITAKNSFHMVQVLLSLELKFAIPCHYLFKSLLFGPRLLLIPKHFSLYLIWKEFWNMGEKKLE